MSFRQTELNVIYTALLRSIFRLVYGKPLNGNDRPEASLVIVADGVGGFDLCGTGLLHLTRHAPHPLIVEIVPWGHGLGRWYADLTRVERHAQQAERIAQLVKRWHRERPENPVHLVGKSGGTGIVVKALERLPAGSVETAVLLAPALSPSYDLAPALAAVNREMVVFWSPLDLIVLGVGTQVFGTIDRKRSVSAGLVGFQSPSGSEPERVAAYRKLRQIRWDPSMIASGYLGGHVGPDNPRFLKRYVLPIFSAKSNSSDSAAGGGGASSRPSG
jgi:pimeloyl-ACP methyl ester carboxylesterase